MEKQKFRDYADVARATTITAYELMWLRSSSLNTFPTAYLQFNVFIYFEFIKVCLPKGTGSEWLKVMLCTPHDLKHFLFEAKVVNLPSCWNVFAKRLILKSKVDCWTAGYESMGRSVLHRNTLFSVDILCIKAGKTPYNLCCQRDFDRIINEHVSCSV